MLHSKSLAIAREFPGVWIGLLRYPGIFLSGDGRVLSVRGKAPRLLKGTRRGKYLALSCVAQGPYLHRVTCEVFRGPAPTPTSEVRHLDGNLDNNAATNLVWGTRTENAADRVRHGTDASGARNGMAKLTPEQVAAMRAEHAENGTPFYKLARRFGVSTMTAYRAPRKRPRRHHALRRRPSSRRNRRR